MGVYEGRGQISKSMKELMQSWTEARREWDDDASRRIEKEMLHPLELDVRNAVGAMEHIAQILAQVKADCRSPS